MEKLPNDGVVLSALFLESFTLKRYNLEECYWQTKQPGLVMRTNLMSGTLRAVFFDLPRLVGKRKRTLLTASSFFELPLIQGNG